MTTELVELAEAWEAEANQMDDDPDIFACLPHAVRQCATELRALASRAGGWISVKDRLPIDLEAFDGVFSEVCVAATDGHFVEAANFQAGNGAGKPWVAWSNYNPFKSTQITHWQPLPEPPAAPEPVAVEKVGMS